MTNELTLIQQQLAANSSKDARDASAHFIPGSNIKIYGVRMPVLNDLASKFKTGGFELAAALWTAGSHEEKILAGKLIGKIAKKDPQRALLLVEKFASALDNWAICDTIGMQSLKPIVASHQKEIFALAKKLNRDQDFWKRRLSLV